MQNQEISIANLDIPLDDSNQQFSKKILVDEINGIEIEHVSIKQKNRVRDTFKNDYRTIYLFIKGTGTVVTPEEKYEIGPETIVLPNTAENITIKAIGNDALHYVKISSQLTPQDLLVLKELPTKNTQKVYCAKFSDCQSYVEPIKSPNTISRTILSNKYIPRVAMGTVQAIGPDEVGAHEHPMLEQLFLGLAKNNCTVYADDAEVSFPEHAILHIPLGSRHSVSVDKDEMLYYVWMDFFLDRKGEEWLKTHIVV